MIWLEVKIPIPKLVVTICHQSDYYIPLLRPLKCTVRVSMIVSAAWLLNLTRWHQIYKIPYLFPHWVSAFDELLLHWLMTPVSFYLLQSELCHRLFLWMTLITAWSVSGVKVVVLGADDENLSTIILSWVVFCAWKFNRNFIHATVKATFLFFCLSFSLKRSILSAEAIHLDGKSRWMTIR